MSAQSFWRMTKGKIMEGVFAINKPTGLSSAQVIRDLQHHFNPSKLFEPYVEHETSKRAREQHNQKKRRRDKRIQVKIGHGGTLDPLATGVLIAGVGQGTKSLQDFLLCTKTYEAVVLFGASTDTYDSEGKVLARAPYSHVTRSKVEEALGQFRGKFEQLPPLYSALKMNGKPLYEYAREGKPIPREIERRKVEVLELDIVEWMEPDTHSYVAPSENASHAEVNVANKLWKQEKAQPAKEPVKERKRRMSEEADDLVSERPASKQQKSSEQDATMSGGLASSPPPTEAATEAPTQPAEIQLPTRSATPTPGPPAALIRMTVTSGFYVRSLAHDLGAAVGSAALMAKLERTRQGAYEVGTDNVLEYSDLEKGEEVWGPKVEGMLDAWNGTPAVKEEVKEEVEEDKEAKREVEEEKTEMGEAGPVKTEDVEEKVAAAAA
ncbi:putative tRNA pseudouridine synthase [Lachnellula suecica]|uniref:tRNA pseudouridine(55) synthase n=1 Tax=Lachnellula suecica TaxID=602035 RepID=A0A8T9BUS2_9HELO|nr:putative tRNA pseudouridine synthase [Lachnellula suecica]